MSGGSHDYIEERVADVVMTLDRICRELLERTDPECENCFSPHLVGPAVTDIMVATDQLRQLGGLLRTVEWEASGDVGENQLKDALREYAANR
jgi:hypothetical protein